MVTNAAICWSLSEGLSGTRGGWGRTAITNENAVAAHNSARAARGLRSARITLSVDVARGRLFPHFLARHARRQLDQLERARMIGAVKYREVGDDHVDDVLAGQRQRALGDELRAAILRHMLHDDDDLLDP